MYRNISTIKFKYCQTYDKVLLKAYPGAQLSENKILDYLKTVETLWKKDGTKILVELSTICHLKWDYSRLDCYLVSSCIPFADPLTIPVYKEHPDYFIDILVHELIHCLLNHEENQKKLKKAWGFIHSKYNGEDLITQNHIPVHAIHQYLFLKYYSRQRLNREIRLISYLLPYRRSWLIVQREGWQNIIDDFVGRIV